MILTAALVATLLVVTGLLLEHRFQYWREARRVRFIEEYRFPPSVLRALSEQHPRLKHSDLVRVQQGLRRFFQIHRLTHPKPIGMPSKVVDDLWHAFILDTKAYQKFCKRAFGHEFDHRPAGLAMDQPVSSPGLRLTWREACRLEGLPLVKGAALPRPELFLIDQQLQIAEGWQFQPEPSWLLENQARARRRDDGDDDEACAGEPASGRGGADGDD